MFFYCKISNSFLNAGISGKSAVDRTDDAFCGRADVASATECTGLMPALPPDDEGAERLAALYAVHPPKRGGKGRKPAKG